MYGSESWAMSINQEKRINVWGCKILRRIYGQVKEGDNCRIRNSQEICIMTARNLEGNVKWNRIKWLGCVQRTEDGRLPKTFFDEQPDGRHLRGRPLIRWRATSDN